MTRIRLVLYLLSPKTKVNQEVVEAHAGFGSSQGQMKCEFIFLSDCKVWLFSCYWRKKKNGIASSTVYHSGSQDIVFCYAFSQETFSNAKQIAEMLTKEISE